jgi:uroporphyrinogen decarboxylase
MQTSREVIHNLFTKGRADRVGFAENIWVDTIQEWVKQGYPTGPDGKWVDPLIHFDFDLASAGGWFDCLPIRGFKEIEEETPDWKVTRNGAGAAFKYWKNKSGTPEHVDFRMTSREVWEREYRGFLLETDRARMNVEETAKNLKLWRGRGKFTTYSHMFVWENMRQSMGDVCLYESLLLDPGWILDYCQVNTDFFIRHFRVLFEEAGLPDAVHLHEDMGYNKGLFCSPKTYQELIFPSYRKVIDFAHSYGLPVMLHSCGRITDILPAVAEVGFDYLDPMERKAGCDPLAFAEKYGDRFVFRGGMDARVLESGDRDLIRKEVIALVEGMKARGARYIFSSDHSLSTNVRYADYQYALEVYKDHCMY